MSTDKQEPPAYGSTVADGFQDAPNREARSYEAAQSSSSAEDAQRRENDEKLLGGSLVVGDDGRVDIDCDSRLTQTIIDKFLRVVEAAGPTPEIPTPGYNAAENTTPTPHPRLNVLIQVVGSRGDVQPFIALGNELQRLGFRVRLATHDVFSDFVRSAGIEFFPVGGDPEALMAYMVKNPGLIPSFGSLRKGRIGKNRDMVEEMLEGFWFSCFQADPLTGHQFVADAIIANPPSFAHVHCAQRLGVPVHLMFTMPWTSTRSFPHPLANLRRGGDESRANAASYAVVEYMTWQGVGDVINRWRRSIDLQPITMFDSMLTERLRIPFTYCWSPALVAKPPDWGAHIDVCGFFFRNPPSYSPPDDLARFLAAGEPPVYIGFGSIVLKYPEQVVQTILDAVRAAGVRAIVSKGWSNLAGTEGGDDVYWIGDCPHEWLFGQVAAVVHHGGAGTTACGLRNGVPTLIVPFFGDQPFWGKMVANAGAGPEPIPFKQLNSENLAEGIRFCMTPGAKSAAQGIAEQMKSEQGVQAAAQSWLRQLPKQQRLACDLIPEQPAAWTYKKSSDKKNPIKMSKVAAEELVRRGMVEEKHLEYYQSKPLHIEVTRWGPVTGTTSQIFASTADMSDALFGMFTKPVDEYKHETRRREREAKREEAASQARSSLSQEQRPGFEDAQHDISKASSQTADSDSASVASRSSKSQKKKRRSMAAITAGASAKSLGMVVPKVAMGLVDVPMAFTEGLRVTPQRFGTKVRDHGPVTDAKSGAVVAGKTLAYGLSDGLSDLVMEPVRGGIKEGPVGVVKGVGRGAVSAVAKTGAGLFGVIAYPGTGIANSIRSAVRSGTAKSIAEARREEGKWLLRESGLPAGTSSDGLVGRFLELKSGQD